MQNLKKCDLCGKIYKENVLHLDNLAGGKHPITRFGLIDENQNIFSMDICDGCTGKIADAYYETHKEE